MEIWDGYYRDETLSPIELIRGNPIPTGLYHLVCEVLVRHIDGDYLLMQRDLAKRTFPGCYEATAGGSALKGEDKLTCVKRELREETGIVSDDFIEIGHFILDDHNCIIYTFLCITDCSKESIALQQGETMSYKWVNEDEFIRFINSGEMIIPQRDRYLNYFTEKGYIPQSEKKHF